MKKIILALISLITFNVVSAQEHNHGESNPNISPFQDSKEVNNGVSSVSLYTQGAWKTFSQKYPSWGATMNKYTKMPHRAFGVPIAFNQGGNDPITKAKLFIQNEMSDFQIPVNELIVTRNYNDGKYIHVDFKQIHNGMEVLWSRVAVRFTQDLKICLVGIDAHKSIPTVSASITSAQAIQFAEQAVTTPILNSEIEATLKIFPLQVDGSIDFRPVYVVSVNTQDDKETPGKYLTYVDAANGKILYRQNKVVHIGFDVKADLYPTNLFAPLANLPLKNLLVNVSGTNYYTDLLGNVVVPNAGPLNATVTLSGKYIKIVTGQNGTTSPTYSPTNVNNGDVLTFPTSSPNATERHMTCYYHANEIHDFMKTKFPSFTAMDNPLTARVDRTDGNCNAFYNGSSINFYTTANGCNALSLISDVMYHEYGHGISNVFWDDQGSSFDNGAMGEGYSDAWAFSITKNPIIGPGFSINQPTSNIRRYDINPKVYPQDIQGEVHADGEIIAGAWYDYAINLSNTYSLSASFDTMSNLFAVSQYGLATGPDGAEGEVYHDILIDALQYDDDDNNLNNGTPHFNDIVQAFAKHGIYLLSNTEFNHTTPGIVSTGNTISISGDAVVDFPAFLGDVKMYFREKGTFNLDSVLMTKSGTNFSTTLPASTTAKVYEYYFNVYDNTNTIATSSPKEARFSLSSSQRNLPFYLIIGYQSVYLQDFEGTLNTNWTVSNMSGDNATAGKWTQAIPTASITEGDTVQTGKDHTTGAGKCLVTANAASANSSVGSADVDGGRTTVVTEELDLSTYNSPIISYWRWYTNSQGSNPRKDVWRAWASYNNGTSWFQLERTYQPDVSWRRNIFIPDLTQGGKVKFMFTATDSAQSGFGGGAIIEAALDDIEILELNESAPAGLATINSLEATIFPNPANQDLNIVVPSKGKINVSLSNTLGQTLLSQNLENNTSYKMNISALSSGIYFVVIQQDGKQFVKKLFVTR